VPPFYTSTITTTTSAALSVPFSPPISLGVVEKRAAAVSIPGFLSGLDPSLLSEVCDCLVTTTITGLTSTVTVGKGATTVAVVVGVSLKLRSSGGDEVLTRHRLLHKPRLQLRRLLILLGVLLRLMLVLRSN